ncbi:MAG: hypothetical protein ABI612_24475 [Betaproteobacteria bacterium]
MAAGGAATGNCSTLVVVLDPPDAQPSQSAALLESTRQLKTGDKKWHIANVSRGELVEIDTFVSPVEKNHVSRAVLYILLDEP